MGVHLWQNPTLQPCSVLAETSVHTSVAKPCEDGCACQPILGVWMRHREEVARGWEPPPASQKSQPKATALLGPEKD